MIDNHDWHVASIPAPDGNWGWLIPCMGWCTKTLVMNGGIRKTGVGVI